MCMRQDNSLSSGDRGSLSAFVACLVTMFIALAGLTFDGGRVISKYVEISDVAANAARAGSQMLVNIRTGNPQLDIPTARARAESVLRLSGVSGNVVATHDGIVVKVRGVVEMKLLSLFGVTKRTVSITRRALPMVGT